VKRALETPRVRILTVPLSAQRYERAIGRLLEATGSEVPVRAHFCTVHSVVEAESDGALRSIFESADMLAMDGVPLVWVARLRGAREAERVCGPDVMLSLCDRGRAIGLAHYFLGGKPGVPEELAQQLTKRFPGLDVVGVESPPFRDLSRAEDDAMVARINNARPHVLWVGLGAPKQEHWAADHQARLRVPLILPVGAAFDFHSGRVRRAPHWMQRAGLEWLFRIVAEPRRLLGRYVVTNSRFMWLVLLDAARRRLRGK